MRERCSAPLAALTLSVFAGIALLAAGCGLIGDDNGGTGGARVGAVVFGTAPNAEGQPTNIRNFFAPNDRIIIALVSLSDVQPGTKVTGRWYTLGFGETPPEGLLINSSDIILTADKITPDRQSVATFTQRSESGFPETPWVLRIYVNDKLARTAGFLVTRAVTTQAAPAPASPAPAPAPTPVTYTVQAGDTLQSVAQRFLPPGANLQAFMTSIATLNNIQPTATLQAGQVLRIPPAP